MSWIIPLSCAVVVAGLLTLSAILFALWDIREELRELNRKI